MTPQHNGLADAAAHAPGDIERVNAHTRRFSEPS